MNRSLVEIRACWRLSAAAQAAAVISWVAILAAGLVGSAHAKPIALLVAKQPGQLTHVQLSMRVGGDLLLQNDGKSRSIPMSVDAHLEYDECLTVVPAAKQKARQSYRYYEQAQATIKLENGHEEPTLSTSRRLISAEVSEGNATLFSPDGPLTARRA